LPGEATDRAAILARVRGLLTARLGLAVDGDPLDEATGLLGQGIGLDSVEVLQLVSAIEETYAITIDDEDLRREYFATLGTVVSFVQERLPA
jgi:acyl carrier protein